MTIKVGIIGRGIIGQALAKKVVAAGWNLKFTADSKHVYKGYDIIGNIACLKNHIPNTDIIFLAISTTDDGRMAADYIKKIAGLVYIVTCEKGALANHFSLIEPYLPSIGYSASVGGGSMMINQLKARLVGNVQEVHLVLNGTLNYWLSGVAAGRPSGQVIQEAKELGYAEPGADSALSIIEGEAVGDVGNKIAALFNVCFGYASLLAANMLDLKIDLDQAFLDRVTCESLNRRYIVSIRKIGPNPFYERRDSATDMIFFHQQVSPWEIEAGFFQINANPIYSKLVSMTPGVDNGFITVEGDNGEDGIYYCGGPGAGPGPTTAAMMNDARFFIEKIANRDKL